MIIVKTDNGAKFVNEKEAVMVCHDKKAKQVSFHTRETMQGVTINDVESVTFITDTQAVEWKDEGSEVEKLKATIESKDKEINMLLRRGRYINHWLEIHKDAICKLKETAKKAVVGVGPEAINAIIEDAEKEYDKSMKAFEEMLEKEGEKFTLYSPACPR